MSKKILEGKECSQCEKYQIWEAYYRDNRRVDGRKAVCKKCSKSLDRLRRPTQKEDRELIEKVESWLGKPLPQQPIKDPSKAFQPRLVVVFCDVHVPEHDLPTWNAALEWIRDHTVTDIVLNGDFMELASCSQHGMSPEITALKADLAAGKAAIKEIREAAPDASITYNCGNHETRLERIILSKIPALHGTLTLEQGLGLKEFDVRWIPEERQPIEIGGLDILHGHQLSGGKHSGLPKHHAAKLADMYGRARRTAVIGHAHRAQVYTKAAYGGNQNAIAVGCMRTLDVKWLHGHQAGWSHQFLVAYIEGNGRTTTYPITVTDGGFMWNGKVYGK